VNDLRFLIQLTKATFWPLPTMSDVMDMVGKNSIKMFSNIDLKHAYFQIKLTKELADLVEYCRKEEDHLLTIVMTSEALDSCVLSVKEDVDIVRILLSSYIAFSKL